MKVIIIGVPTLKDANNEITCCLEEFRNRGIHVDNLFFAQKSLQTKNCYIRFVPERLFDRVRGTKADVTFGLSEERQCLVNRSHRPTDYKGTFLDYVYEVESLKNEEDI